MELLLTTVFGRKCNFPIEQRPCAATQFLELEGWSISYCQQLKWIDKMFWSLVTVLLSTRMVTQVYPEMFSFFFATHF